MKRPSGFDRAPGSKSGRDVERAPVSRRPGARPQTPDDVSRVSEEPRVPSARVTPLAPAVPIPLARVRRAARTADAGSMRAGPSDAGPSGAGPTDADAASGGGLVAPTGGPAGESSISDSPDPVVRESDPSVRESDLAETEPYGRRDLTSWQKLGAVADPLREAKKRLRAAKRTQRKSEQRDQRRFTAHARRRRLHILIGFGAVVLLAATVAIGTLTPIMAVREIQITGANRVAVFDIEQALGDLEGTPLALVSEGEVHSALEAFPLVQRFAIERIPPHTLVVRIEERDPVIAVPAGSSLELRDPAGVLVGRADERPAGVALAGDELTDPSSAAFRAAAKVIRDVPGELREQIVEVTASSAHDVRLTLASGSQVLWGGADRSQMKARVLGAMLVALDGRSPQLIDVSAPDAPVFQ